MKRPYIFQQSVLKSEALQFCHVFTSEGLFLVAGAIGLVTSINFGWDIMLMNTRYIHEIGIGFVQLLLSVVQLLLGVV